MFGLDALETSSPTSVPIYNPYYDTASTAIYYSKGSCLVRMLEHVLTLEVFNDGVHNYLVNKAYHNAKRTGNKAIDIYFMTFDIII